MSEIKEYVAHLSQTIGPRPAGTEEEQQAALYLAEALQSEATLTASVEDFNCNPDFGMPRAICAGVAALMALLATIVPVMVIPALIITLVTAALFAAESLGKPVVSRLLNRGVSQNVVAKYEPTSSEAARRRRKIILVAHYDSGRVQKGLTAPILSALPYIRWAELGAMVLIPFLLLIRLVTSAEGGLSVFLSVLTVIALIVAVLPLVAFVMDRTAPYNEGANCNAAGVSVLMEVAARIGRGRVSEEELARQEAVMHGEDAALASGFIPAGAELDYDEPAFDLASDESPEARLLAAKAAVAALSGRPVSETINIDIADKLVQVKEPPVASASDEDMRARREEAIDAFAPVEVDVVADQGANHEEAAAAGITEEAVAAASAGMAAASSAAVVSSRAAHDSSDVPAWFKAAQAKARKPASAAPVHRSRYAEALDAAERELAQRTQHVDELAPTEAERRLQRMRDSILEEQASDFEQVASLFERGQQAQQDHPAAAQPVTPYEGAPHQAAGVEGFLSSVTSKAGYDPTASAADGTVPAPAPVRATGAGPAPTVDAGGASEVAPEVAPVTEPQIGEVMIREVSVEPLRAATSAPQGRLGLQAVPAVRVLDASALESLPSPTDAFAADGAPVSVDGSSASAASLPDRTISFIPVAVDGEALKRESRELAAAGQPAPQIPGLLENPAAGQAEEPKKARRKRAITLPSLTGSLAPIAEHKQNAPLADPSARAQDLRGAVPAVAGLDNAGSSEATRQAQKASLRASLPSLSGVIAAQNSASSHDQVALEEEAPSNVSQAGSFASIGATGAFAPVGDELVEDVAPDEMYVDDADDSAYEESYTETGAFAGPGYVEMPKSRASRILGKLGFGRKNKQEEVTPQQWLDVDDSFDARAVGKARGGWESFREDQEAPDTFAAGSRGYDDYDDYADGYDEYAEYDEYEDYVAEGEDAPRATQETIRWNGGGFSRESLTHALVRVKSVKEKIPVHGGAPDERAAGYADDYAEGEDAFSYPAGESEMPITASAGAPVDLAEENLAALEEIRAENVQRIYGFRHPDINTEVWFVALGADLAGNAGMDAFLTEHAAELKGSVIVNLDGLGAGELTLIEQEGTYRPVKGSSRMKRFVRKASAALGMSVGTGSMLWKDSATACAARRGYQTMHLAGMEAGKPALYGEAHDVADGVDEETMLRNADFVMEILKNI
ncbi:MULTISPECIES: aminopeptidase [unclassified Adlercreutzia]|uniref:aminopeptidase n=1 Tax=unclassified Adlercreutzia TaxID=2636013 RepID=UPI0013EA7064|nr:MULTISPECIES: aminopeptidase [unclassified Adlercreutzia]